MEEDWHKNVDEWPVNTTPGSSWSMQIYLVTVVTYSGIKRQQLWYLQSLSKKGTLISASVAPHRGVKGVGKRAQQPTSPAAHAAVRSQFHSRGLHFQNTSWFRPISAPPAHRGHFPGWSGYRIYLHQANFPGKQVLRAWRQKGERFLPLFPRPPTPTTSSLDLFMRIKTTYIYIYIYIYIERERERERESSLL